MPSLTEIGTEKVTEKVLAHMGIETDAELVAHIIGAAQAKGTSKGKGKGKTYWNCGEQGRFARECPNNSQKDTTLQVLKKRGRRKGQQR